MLYLAQRTITYQNAGWQDAEGKVPMSKQEIIRASELNRAPGKVLRRVAVSKEPIVVESDGYPIVALIPYAEYEQWRRVRARAEMLAFMEKQARLSKIEGLDTISDEEAMADALKVVKEVRREKRRKK